MFHVNMLPLAKVAKLESHKVMKMLTRLPQSRYYGVHGPDMYNLISPNDARRYLTALTILNEKERSDLSQVDEMSMNDELSQLFDSIEGGQLQQLRVPSLTNLVAHRNLNNSEPGLNFKQLSNS